MDIICDELKQNNVDIDKETLSYHINVILNKNHELFEAARVHSLTVNLSRFYKEINVTNFGRFIAYSALVYRASDSLNEETIRQAVRLSVEVIKIFNLEKFKRSKKSFRSVFVMMSFTLAVLYVILKVSSKLPCVVHLILTVEA
jgi:hypothetical protein